MASFKNAMSAFEANINKNKEQGFAAALPHTPGNVKQKQFGTNGVPAQKDDSCRTDSKSDISKYNKLKQYAAETSSQSESSKPGIEKKSLDVSKPSIEAPKEAKAATPRPIKVRKSGKPTGISKEAKSSVASPPSRPATPHVPQWKARAERIAQERAELRKEQVTATTKCKPNEFKEQVSAAVPPKQVHVKTVIASTSPVETEQVVPAPFSTSAANKTKHEGTTKPETAPKVLVKKATQNGQQTKKLKVKLKKSESFPDIDPAKLDAAVRRANADCAPKKPLTIPSPKPSSPVSKAVRVKADVRPHLPRILPLLGDETEPSRGTQRNDSIVNERQRSYTMSDNDDCNDSFVESDDDSTVLLEIDDDVYSDDELFDNLEDSAGCLGAEGYKLSQCAKGDSDCESDDEEEYKEEQPVVDAVPPVNRRVRSTKNNSNPVHSTSVDGDDSDLSSSDSSDNDDDREAVMQLASQWESRVAKLSDPVQGVLPSTGSIDCDSDSSSDSDDTSGVWGDRRALSPVAKKKELSTVEAPLQTRTEFPKSVPPQATVIDKELAPVAPASPTIPESEDSDDSADYFDKIRVGCTLATYDEQLRESLKRQQAAAKPAVLSPVSLKDRMKAFQ